MVRREDELVVPRDGLESMEFRKQVGLQLASEGNHAYIGGVRLTTLYRK